MRGSNPFTWCSKHLRWRHCSSDLTPDLLWRWPPYFIDNWLSIEVVELVGDEGRADWGHSTWRFDVCGGLYALPYALGSEDMECFVTVFSLGDPPPQLGPGSLPVFRPKGCISCLEQEANISFHPGLLIGEVFISSCLSVCPHTCWCDPGQHLLIWEPVLAWAVCVLELVLDSGVSN